MESGEDESVFNALSTVLGSMLKNTFFLLGKAIAPSFDLHTFFQSLDELVVAVLHEEVIFVLGV